MMVVTIGNVRCCSLKTFAKLHGVEPLPEGQKVPLVNGNDSRKLATYKRYNFMSIPEHVVCTSVCDKQVKRHGSLRIQSILSMLFDLDYLEQHGCFYEIFFTKNSYFNSGHVREILDVTLFGPYYTFLGLIMADGDSSSALPIIARLTDEDNTYGSLRFSLNYDFVVENANVTPREVVAYFKKHPFSNIIVATCYFNYMSYKHRVIQNNMC